MGPVRAQISSWSLAIPAQSRSVSERAYVITCELLMHYRKRGPWIWRYRLETEPTLVGPGSVSTTQTIMPPLS